METLLKQLVEIGSSLNMSKAKDECKAFILKATLTELKALKNATTLIAWLDRDCYTKQGSLTGSGLPALIEIEEQASLLCDVIRKDTHLTQADKDRLCDTYKLQAVEVVSTKRYGENAEKAKKILLVENAE